MDYLIEHLEKLSEWLELEYRHCSNIADVLFTNVGDREEQERIADFGRFEPRQCAEILGEKEVLVLDPQAEKLLEPQDFRDYSNIVIGGILGDAVPRGRTCTQITSKLNAIPRSLGPYQLSIDGATFLAKKIEEGNTLEELEVANCPEIELSEKETTTLHYAIPVFGGKPIITPGLLEYLTKEK